MLRAVAFTLTILMSGQAQGAGFAFVPGADGAAGEFKELLEAGNFQQALQAWPSAHQQSTFGNSETGTALYAYLLFHNGMPFTGLQLLTQRTAPARLHPEMLKLWSTELKNSTIAQKGWISSTAPWKRILNNEPVTISIKNKKDCQAAFARAAGLGKDQVNAKTRVWWQIATRAPLNGDVECSLKALKLIEASGQTAIGHDMIALAHARVLYQKGDMDAALGFFNQVPKGSSLWVEALEERTWAHLRLADHDKALGEVTTLMSPVLAPLVGPESYFLSNLMSLKVCDYPRLFKTSELFKKRHRERLAEIQDLATKGTSRNLNSFMDRLEKGGVNIDAAGPLVTSIPSGAWRDTKFIRYVETRRALLGEIAKAGQISSTLGAQSELEGLVAANRVLAESMKQLAHRRVRELAMSDLKEYRMVLNKMHIIEAQVIERLHLDENLKGRRSQLAKADDKGDVLVFPYSGDEVWFDELDNYKARVKDCPTLKGASL